MTFNPETTAAWKKLGELAESPVVLNAPGLLGEARFTDMSTVTAGLKLVYATQKVDAQVISTLQELADELRLVERFKQMRAGLVINRIEGWESENRQVLHTATRDIFSSKPRHQEATGQALVELEKLKTFLNELDQGSVRGSTGKPFSSMINIGIGGSDLGPRSIYEALKAYRQPDRSVHFIANVDPDDAAAVLTQLDLEETLVSVVSKSGTTLETLTNETLVRSAFVERGLDPNLHCVAVTGKGSPMDNSPSYFRSFHMFDYIGGRFSSTSMVGALMLGYALGMDNLMAFLGGANKMDDGAESSDITANIPLMLALIGVWNHNLLGYPTVAVLPYCQALHRFPAHLQQCDMESNGKSVRIDGSVVTSKTGPIVWGEPGTNGQHAFYQLLHQGTEIVPIEFIGFTESQYGHDLQVSGTTSQQKLVANMLAQCLALAQGQDHENPNKRFAGDRPSSLIIGKTLDPRTMGALLALYEAKIVYQGFTWNINSFDQEGVQLGKVLAERFLGLMKGAGFDDSSMESEMLKVLEK